MISFKKKVAAKVSAMKIVRDHGPYNPRINDPYHPMQVNFIENDKGEFFGVWREDIKKNWAAALTGPFKTLTGAKNHAQAAIH